MNSKHIFNIYIVVMCILFKIFYLLILIDNKCIYLFKVKLNKKNISFNTIKTANSDTKIISNYKQISCSIGKRLAAPQIATSKLHIRSAKPTSDVDHFPHYFVDFPVLTAHST